MSGEDIYSIPMNDIDLETQVKNSGGRNVGFTSEFDGTQSGGGSGDSDDEGEEFYYPQKRRGGGYSQVDGGDLSTSTTTLSQIPEEGVLVSNKEKGKRKKKRRGSNSRSHNGRQSNRRAMRRTEPRLVKMGLVILVPIILLLGVFFLVSMTSKSESKNTSPVVAPTGFTYPSGFNIKNNWGALSPYFDSGTPFAGLDAMLPGTAISGFPQQCSLKQAHVLHRHAERYPTPDIGAKMEDLGEKLKSMAKPPAKAFAWLDAWNYTLKTDLLVASGVGTLFDSGSDFWESHGQHLFNSTEKGYVFYDPALNVYENGTAKNKPVLRATTQSRIETSAKAWAAGFFGVYGDDPARSADYDANNLYKLVLQEETDGMNSTLAGYFGCPNSNNQSYSPGPNHTLQWIDTYLADTAIRLQKLLPGFDNITAYDAFTMQNLCAYEACAYGNSPFCSLFTETEWRGFEYSFDLDFHGVSSYGAAVGPAVGAGWVYELIARLEGQLITEPKYGVNVSLTNNEDTFPVNQSLYVDVTHDAAIVSILTAIGFDFLKEKLPTTKIPVPRQFIISRLTPFGARLYVEVLECDPSITKKAIGNQYVRIKLNNRILPLNSLKFCPDDKTGLCPHSKFIESLTYALEQIDFETACYGEPTDWWKL